MAEREIQGGVPVLPKMPYRTLKDLEVIAEGILDGSIVHNGQFPDCYEDVFLPIKLGALNSFEWMRADRTAGVGMFFNKMENVWIWEDEHPVFLDFFALTKGQTSAVIDIVKKKELES